MSTRITDCPRSLRFSSSARPMAMGPWKTSDSTAIIALCRSASMNVGSCRIVT